MSHATLKVHRPATFEREAELGVLREALRQADRGAGGIVMVEGPLGIGKSRLLDEARAFGERQRVQVLTARGGELEKQYSWGVILRLFEEHVGGLDAAARTRAFRGRAALAERLLCGAALIETDPSPQREFALIHALYWLVVNLSESRPLALVVDDLHWVDEPSMRCIHYLAERLSDLPVLLIVAARVPAEGSTDALIGRLANASRFPRLRPAELSLDATREVLAESGVAAADHPAAVAACYRTTGGNPLLVRELVLDMTRVPRLAESVDAAAIERAAPRSLEARIIPRIMGAGPHALQVARATALIGNASLAVVAPVVGASLNDTLEISACLVDAGIFSQADPPAFAHPMMRSVVIAAISGKERLNLHTACASALHEEGAASEEIARHLIQGAPIVRRWAVGALQEAARSAASRGASAAAISYLRHGIRGLPSSELRASLLVDLGLLEAATGQTASLERFELALEVLGDEVQQRRALYALGQTLYRYGRHEEAVVTFRRGADRFADTDASTAMHFEAAWACAVAHFAARVPDARQRLGKLARQLPTEGELTAPQRALCAAFALHSAVGNPPAPATSRLARAALEGDVLIQAEGFGSVPVSQAVVALLLTEQFDDADRALATFFAEARRRNDALLFAEASMIRSHVRLAQGRIVDAIADAEAALEGVDAGWADSPQFVHASLATCLLERGELDAAEKLLETSVASESDGMVAEALRLGARARLRVARGDYDGAERDCEVNRDALDAAGMTNPNLAVWRPILSAIREARGDRAGAVAIIQEELDVAEEWCLPNRIGAALRMRAALVAGPSARSDLETSLSVLADGGTPLEQARSQYALGELLHASGELEPAREALRTALSIAHRGGSSALERDARRALIAAGGRPRRPATEGAKALTPSERRIADLAAAGESNRAIAEALFLTKNTVEWHMRNIFKKLEVNARREIGARLAVDEELERHSAEPLAEPASRY